MSDETGSTTEDNHHVPIVPGKICSDFKTPEYCTTCLAVELSILCVCVHTLFSAQHMAKSTNYDAVIFRYCFFLDKEKLGFE